LERLLLEAEKLKTYIKYTLTALIVLAAAAAVRFKYWDHVTNAWTRDGQVCADVIQLTPRVSGPIVTLPIRDNQFVKAGDLLFEIDPRTFQTSLTQAKAQYDEAVDGYNSKVKQVEVAKAQVEMAKAQVQMAKAQVEVARASIIQAESAIKQEASQITKDKAEFQRQQDLLPKRATSQKSVDRARANYEVSLEQRKGAESSLVQAKASLTEAQASLAQSQASQMQSQASLAEAQATLGTTGDDNANLRSARAAIREAELNLEFTRVIAPVDGYITNLNLRHGSHAVANQAVLALVDTNSYWVHGYFRETLTGKIKPGDEAVVTLMSYPDTPLKGTVDSLGWGIAQQDGSTGFDLLPNVNPTFEWIRLAQRVPVRVHLKDVPKEIKLRVGTTASVMIKTRSSQATVND
jgi:multidrug resistance efflux pump